MRAYVCAVARCCHARPPVCACRPARTPTTTNIRLQLRHTRYTTIRSHASYHDAIGHAKHRSPIGRRAHHRRRRGAHRLSIRLAWRHSFILPDCIACQCCAGCCSRRHCCTGASCFVAEGGSVRFFIRRCCRCRTRPSPGTNGPPAATTTRHTADRCTLGEGRAGTRTPATADSARLAL